MLSACAGFREGEMLQGEAGFLMSCFQCCEAQIRQESLKDKVRGYDNIPWMNLGKESRRKRIESFSVDLDHLSRFSPLTVCVRFANKVPAKQFSVELKKKKKAC